MLIVTPNMNDTDQSPLFDGVSNNVVFGVDVAHYSVAVFCCRHLNLLLLLFLTFSTLEANPKNQLLAPPANVTAPLEIKRWLSSHVAMVRVDVYADIVTSLDVTPP